MRWCYLLIRRNIYSVKIILSDLWLWKNCFRQAVVWVTVYFVTCLLYRENICGGINAWQCWL